MLSLEIRKDKGTFVDKPFNNWHKLREKADKHQQMKYHHDALICGQSFLDSVHKPEQNVNNLLDVKRRKNIETNRHIVKCIAEAILFCGRQCIALRGDNEDLSKNSGNVGNFLAALQMIANHDKILKEHLQTHGLAKGKEAKYTSPKIQNEVIEIIGQDIILKGLVDEIKAAQLYSIMADEVTSHNKEQLALCVRFIDKNNEAREEFIAFINVPRITGEAISEAIITTLRNLGLDIKNIRGQGYDGASNMSSDNVGVQRRIKEQSPKAAYVHCSGHCLNLVIAHSCSLPQIRNALDKLKQVSLFFQGSPKREGKKKHKAYCGNYKGRLNSNFSALLSFQVFCNPLSKKLFQKQIAVNPL